MESLEEIRKMLKDFTAGEMQIFPAKVLSVNFEEKTCVVKPGSDPEMKARLKSAINQEASYHVLYPKENTSVLVGLILNNPEKAYVVAYGELQAMECRIGDQSYYMDADGHVFNGGQHGGIVKYEQLLNEYNKTKELLDALMTVISGGPIPEAGAGAPSAFQAALSAATVGKGTGSLNGITNDKVKH